jgi:hypothetical protein
VQKDRKKQEKEKSRCKLRNQKVVFILGKKLSYGAKEIQSAPPKSRREKETMLGCTILGLQKIKA